MKMTENVEDADAAYAAGYGEGFMSHDAILAMFINNFDDWFADQQSSSSSSSSTTTTTSSSSSATKCING